MNTFRLSAACALVLTLAITLAGCNQSASGVGEDAPLLAPSAGLQAKADDTIKILSGELVYDASVLGARLDLKGTAGFRLATGNAYEPGYPPTGCYPCGPGTVALNGQPNSYSDLIGTATVRGRTYRLGNGNDDASVGFAFSGTVTLPPFTGSDVIELSAPFTFTGTIIAFDGPGAPRVSADLAGGGVATLRFEAWHVDSVTHVWKLRNAVYEFE
jgi:predicted small secreted protein